MERDLRLRLPPRAVVAERQEPLRYDCDGLTLERHIPLLSVLPEPINERSAVLSCGHRPRISFVAAGRLTETGPSEEKVIIRSVIVLSGRPVDLNAHRGMVAGLGVAAHLFVDDATPSQTHQLFT